MPLKVMARWCSGGENSGSTALLSNVKRLDVHYSHGLALLKDDTAIGWGSTVPAHVTMALDIAAGYGSTSSVVIPTTNPTRITAHPADINATAGSNVTFSVAATGDGTLTYQWQKNGVNISGATLATLTLSNVQISDSSDYRCLVSHKHGTLTSYPGSLIVSGTSVPVAKPVIVTHPAGANVLTGANVSFQVTATGVNLNYQWQKNNSNIAGANASTLTLTNVQLEDNGTYRVTITNGAGSVTSNGAVSTLAPAGWVTITGLATGTEVPLTMRLPG